MGRMHLLCHCRVDSFRFMGGGSIAHSGLLRVLIYSLLQKSQYVFAPQTLFRAEQLTYKTPATFTGSHICQLPHLHPIHRHKNAETDDSSGSKSSPVKGDGGKLHTEKEAKPRPVGVVCYLTLQMSPFLQLLNKSYTSMIAVLFQVLCNALRRPVWWTGEHQFDEALQFVQGTKVKLESCQTFFARLLTSSHRLNVLM